MASDMRRRELTTARLDPRSAFGIADMMAGGSVDDNQMGEASREAARGVGLGAEEAHQGGPKSRMAKIAARAELLGPVQRFEAPGGGRTVFADANRAWSRRHPESGAGGTPGSSRAAGISPRWKKWYRYGRPIFQLEVRPNIIFHIWEMYASSSGTALSGSRKQWPERQEA